MTKKQEPGHPRKIDAAFKHEVVLAPDFNEWGANVSIAFMAGLDCQQIIA